MSHCTRFDFTYSSEEAIVKAFRKLNIKCSTEMISEFSSDFEKHILCSLGYAGKKQYRSIVGEIEGGNLFLCRVDENNYQLYVEHSDVNNEAEDEVWAKKFQKAYIEVAVDKLLKKFDMKATRYEVNHMPNGLVVNFGSNLEYTLSVLAQNDNIVEEVSGVKGDFCTKLTEDIEDILSLPTTELKTEWKVESEMQVEDEALQILSLSF